MNIKNVFLVLFMFVIGQTTGMRAAEQPAQAVVLSASEEIIYKKFVEVTKNQQIPAESIAKSLRIKKDDLRAVLLKQREVLVAKIALEECYMVKSGKIGGYLAICGLSFIQFFGTMILIFEREEINMMINNTMPAFTATMNAHVQQNNAQYKTIPKNQRQAQNRMMYGTKKVLKAVPSYMAGLQSFRSAYYFFNGLNIAINMVVISALASSIDVYQKVILSIRQEISVIDNIVAEFEAK